MKPATSSKKKAAILAVLVGLFALYYYYVPFPWVGVVVALLSGTFTFFILKTRRMERLRLTFFLCLSLFVITTLTANIIYFHFDNFMIWAKEWSAGYYFPGAANKGTTPFPLPILIPNVILGRADFDVLNSVWNTAFATSLSSFLLLMVPFVITFLVFDRSFCGWICPMGGIPEGMTSLGGKRRWFIKSLERKPSDPVGFSLTGLSGLKGWVEWVRYGILLGLILLSVLVPFAIVNIISPALWVKSMPVFWIGTVIFIVFAIVLPFMTNRRWWCDVVCPVGSSLALFHKVSLFRVKIDKAKCNECMDCVQECRTFAMTPQGVEKGGPESGNCIKCARCIEACPEEAIDINLLGKYKARAPFMTLVIVTILAWYLWFVVLLVSYATRPGSIFS